MEKRLRELLSGVSTGELSVDEAMEAMKDLPFSDLGYALVDHHRQMRCGFPEVVFCQSKTAEQVSGIFKEILSKGNDLLATRVSVKLWESVSSEFEGLFYHEAARVVTYRTGEADPKGLVYVLAAGTSDIPVAEEARITAEMLGACVENRYDVGVAGIHRLFDCLSEIRGAACVVVVAGMEGALASVVGGLVDRPVVAVPTSVGYGASFGGIAPLLAMLNSCSAGVSVVNIDNGFGGGFVAGLINRGVGEGAVRHE
jgi:NCAIR mutase (PurE)-related protein